MAGRIGLVAAEVQQPLPSPLPLPLLGVQLGLLGVQLGVPKGTCTVPPSIYCNTCTVLPSICCKSNGCKGYTRSGYLSFSAPESTWSDQGIVGISGRILAVCNCLGIGTV